MTEGASCVVDWEGGSDGGAGSVLCGKPWLEGWRFVGVLPMFERAESGLFS